MKDFNGKTAVITGGASGIGLAIAKRLAREGMRIVVADVEKPALERAVAELEEAGAETLGVEADVSSFESVETLARRAADAFGKVHVLCNNAGVGAQEDAPVWDLPLNDWRWTISVNLWGVIHGIKAFLPGMLAHGEEGHVVNTSSGNGGLIVLPNTPIYATSKAAVSALSEALYSQLVQLGAKIKASILYPGPYIVTSNIFDARRNRPAEYERETEQVMPPITLDMILEMAKGAGVELKTTEPTEVAEQLLDGLRADRYYILPPSEDSDARFRQRVESVLARSNPVPPKLF